LPARIHRASISGAGLVWTADGRKSVHGRVPVHVCHAAALGMAYLRFIHATPAVDGYSDGQDRLRGAGMAERECLGERLQLRGMCRKSDIGTTTRFAKETRKLPPFIGLWCLLGVLED